MLAPSTSCPEPQLLISERDENICLGGDWEAQRRVSRGEDSPYPGAAGESLPLAVNFGDSGTHRRRGREGVSSLSRPAPPTSDLCSLPAPSTLGIGTFPPSSVVALGKVGRATQSPSAPTGRGAMWAQRWGRCSHLLGNPSLELVGAVSPKIRRDGRISCSCKNILK